MTRVEYYFDFSCPFAYLGATQIEALCARHGAELVWRPMLLGGVFRAHNTPNVPAAHMSAAKARHNALDMYRWADVFGVPLVLPSAHPMRTVRALRALLSLPTETWPPVIHAFFARYWIDAQDITTPDSVRLVLERAGLSATAVEQALAANDDPRAKEDLVRRTDEAVARDVFGAPTVFVQHGATTLSFWGQDRLHMVDKALGGWRPQFTVTEVP